MTSNIFLASDLHHEVWGIKGAIEVPEGANMVVIAGDLMAMPLALKTCGLTADVTGLPVIFVPGNHEYYHADYHAMTALANHYEHHNVFVLINKSIVINGIRILGTPLWTNFLSLGEQAHHMHVAETFINDFQVISNRDKPLTAADMLGWHQQARHFLENELSKPFDGKTLVVTHFPPSIKLCHPLHRGSQLTAYFNAACDDVLAQYQPDAWFYGHTHAAVETELYGVRLYCNQGGYPGEQNAITGFDPARLITL